MIELFKTNILHKDAKKQILTSIRQQWPGIIATLELEDNDKVLRVVGAWAPVPVQDIINLVKNQGFVCEPLND